MNPNLAGLLQACKDEPFDDGLRLILADYLEDHDDPDRAELIRLQLAMTDTWGEEADLVAQKIRCEQLIRANAERWFGSARSWFKRGQIQRGFLVLTATARQFLDHPPTELPDEVIPWLEGLELRGDPDGRDDVLTSSLLGLFSAFDFGTISMRDSVRKVGEPDVRRLVANPALARARSLTLDYGQLTFDAMRLLARCDHLAGLRELDLAGNILGDALLNALAEAPWIANLTRLNLSQTQAGERGLRDILAQTHGLTHLNLASVSLDEPTARVLAESPQLASVKNLDLIEAEATDGAVGILAESPYLRPTTFDANWVLLGEVGATALAEGPLLSRVEKLHLCDNGWTADDATMLFESESLANLTFLQMWNPLDAVACETLSSSGQFAGLGLASLRNTGIDAAGAAALARGRHLGALTSLCLDENKIGYAGTRALADGPGLPALEALYLCQTQPQSRGVEALVRSGLAGRLQRLQLEGNRLTDKAAIALSRMSVSQLVELSLGNNCIGSTGTAALANCSGLTRLRTLFLWYNPIRDAGVQALIDSPYLCLTDLRLDNNQLTEAGVAALRDWPHRARMHSLRVSEANVSDELQEQIRVETV